METNDDVDLDKLIQDELDTISLDEPIDDIVIVDDDNDTNRTNDEEEIIETRRNLERDMQERLVAFENEIKMNFNRYEIDYSEIDELLQKPIGNNENEIQTNVARQCGIEREELDQILRSINAEELPVDTSIDSEISEYEVHKIKIVEQSLPTTETDESVEPTPREQEDPNKKLHEERLAESHRRMLDELALLEQRRTEEEERYAAVLQEQQTRLAEEYRRLQETLDESTRQNQNEKLQFETLCREQERLTNERQNKMASVIQAWYRGKRVYRQYHGEIIKRATPTLRAIAKKRKKKEQEDLANATKLTKIQEDTLVEKENDRKVQTTSIPQPSNNRTSSPLPETVTKQPNQVHKAQPVSNKEITSVKEDLTKKRKIKQPSTVAPKQISKPSLPTTQIMQLENPADFIPTIIPEQRNTSTPRLTHIENKNRDNVHRIASPIQTKEQRPKSSNKRENVEPAQLSATTSNLPRTNESILPAEQLNITPIKSTVPASTEDFSLPITRSDTFDKSTENSTLPLIESIPVKKSIKRSETFDTETENVSPPPVAESRDTISPVSIVRSDTFVNKSEKSSSPLPAETIPSTNPTDTVLAYLEKRSDIFVSKSQTPPPSKEIISSTKPTDVVPTYLENRSDTFTSRVEDVPPSNESLSIINALPIDLSSSIEQPESIPIKADIPIKPRVSSPRKAPVEGKHPIKAIYSFLNEARRWAEQTRDVTYSNLLLSVEDTYQQIPTRKTGGTLRKLPEIDSQILIKASKNQSPKEIRYLLLEQLLTPCSLSLIGMTYPNITHLILRQCKLVQLVGLESCSSLTILDIEGNWLEQIHLQSNHLEYLNMSRNRVTSLLSLNTPRLRYLNVSKNRLTRLNGLETLTNLNILLATSNQLLTTIGLQGCTHLLHLDVSDNHLVEMEQLDQCPLLITMKGTSNALIQIPNLFNAILLNELDLSSNSLTSFDELSIGSWLPFLTHLKLSNNSLQELSMIKLPALIEFDLAFNQISDISTVKRLTKFCPLLSRINLEQNPVLCDTTDALEIKEKTFTNPITLLPQLSTEQSSESIELYLNFLASITSMLVTIRQTIEQHQTEPIDSMKSIHHHCQQYYEQKIIEPMPMEITTKVLSPEEQSIIRLQAHWRRRLLERKLKKKRCAARTIQAHWRGYAVRKRMRTVRRLHSQQQQQIYDEIDLTQFDFDEAAFDARFQRPHTPTNRVRQVWQPQHHVLAKTTTITELSRPHSSRSSSAASSHAKPLIEPLAMQSRTTAIANEWGFTPSSTTAALMLKRAEKMKWNAERKHKREHMDAYQRLQMARNNEQPPGSLRLARRQQQLANSTKPVAKTKGISPPPTSQSRPNRVFEWVHTQVARFDESSVRDIHSPRHERNRLPSLDGSIDLTNRIHSNEISQQQQQQRWPSSTVPVRQPPSLLPPINGHLPRV